MALGSFVGHQEIIIVADGDPIFSLVLVPDAELRALILHVGLDELFQSLGVFGLLANLLYLLVRQLDLQGDLSDLRSTGINLHVSDTGVDLLHLCPKVDLWW